MPSRTTALRVGASCPTAEWAGRATSHSVSRYAPPTGPIRRTGGHMRDQAPLLERAFALDPDEQTAVSTVIAGELPSFLRGTYYLNGPARFARGGVAYRHWLDGDGMVSALRFDGRRAHYTNRFVRTTKFLTEEKAERPVF